MRELIYNALHKLHKMNIPYISNKLFKYDRNYEVYIARKNAKNNEVYIAWNNSNKKDPTSYLSKVDNYTIESSLVYYWICEDDLTLLTKKQLNNMHNIGLHYYNYL